MLPSCICRGLPVPKDKEKISCLAMTYFVVGLKAEWQ
jgi:hypothetical protein